MTELEKSLGYQFQDRSLLETALTHSSYANEHRREHVACNERLEFLGDSILGVTAAEYLYKNHPQMPEGDMTKRRAALVCEESLAAVGKQLKLGNYLRFGRGEQAGGRQRNSIIADAVEALLAAIYLDGGREKVEPIIHRLILSQPVLPATKDHKTALQELVQRESGHDLHYELIGESGPDHLKCFTVSVLLDGAVLGTGEGHSKKEAEQAAAAAALQAMQD